jgi:hypothetical protein
MVQTAKRYMPSLRSEVRGTIVDPEGYAWMVATHIAEPTPQEMKKRMKDQMYSQPSTSQELAAAATAL